ncbi:hypothetical protein GQ53DRAFT_782765 [Thozetella sp. PMI_491]|nr:hypothetical protein GQ53DRAFT_782765 [Thozetella sp. PMI_491]
MPEFEIKILLWSKLRNSYPPDAARTCIKISWFRGDSDGFVAGSQRMSQSRARPMHIFSPAEIHLHINKAVSESTGSIVVRFEHDDVEYDCTGRVEERWRLPSLEAIYDRDAIQPFKPDGLQKALVLSTTARKGYQCLSWIPCQSIFKIDQSLPGVDIPGSGSN